MVSYRDNQRPDYTQLIEDSILFNRLGVDRFLGDISLSFKNLNDVLEYFTYVLGVANIIKHWGDNINLRELNKTIDNFVCFNELPFGVERPEKTAKKNYWKEVITRTLRDSSGS